MRCSIAVLFALTGVVGVVGSAAAAGGPGDPSSAPDKTVGPTTPTTAPPGAPPAGLPPSSVPPLGSSPAQPTVPAPPTSAWLPTTTLPAAPTLPATTPTLPPPTGTPTVAPAPGFDGVTFLTEIYAAVNDDPFTLIDIAERQTIINSAADLFVAHLLGATISDQLHDGPPTPTYTVAADGKGVRVCADTGRCDVFGDFLAPTGLLESFTVNGVLIDDSFGVTRREVVVEAMRITSVLCLSAIDGTLSCVVLVESEGAASVLSWEQAIFTAVDGRQFPVDLTLSAFVPSLSDGGFGSGHLVFAGAPIDGDLTIPVVTGVSGTQSMASIPIRAL